MKPEKIYQNLDIPEPSADFEERIIGHAFDTEKRVWKPLRQAIAALFIVVVGGVAYMSVAPQSQNGMSLPIAEEELISDDDVYDDLIEISYLN